MVQAFLRIVRRSTPDTNKTRIPKLLGIRVLFVLLLGAFSYTRAYMPTRVYAAPSSTLNFQARLYNSSGSTVADGTYSVQFKLYTASSGGTNEWTETQASLTSKNGYFSAKLGSITPFASTIDWSQEKWLTLNINSDGEMNPRIKLTAVPYSFRSSQADSLTNGSGTLTADNLAQLSPSSVQAVNTALAVLRINQTGTGLLAQLQGDGADVFTIAKNGNLTSSGSASFSGGTLSLGNTTQVGLLVLQNGSAKTGTIQVGTLAANRTYTLPDADGTICLTTTCTGGGGGPTNAYVQDGNTFGAIATLGTNDVFGLALETGGLQRVLIDAGGNVGIGTSGTPSQLLSIGGTTGNFTVSSSGSLIAADITSNGALNVLVGGASINGGLNNNSGGITNAGNITGVGTNITATAGLTIASGGTSDLTLSSASGLLALSAGTIQTVDNLALDLAKAIDTTLTLQNSGTGITNLNLLDGGLYTGGTQRVSNTGALQNITGLTVISGGASINGNITLGGSSSDRLTITGQLGGASPLVFQGVTDDIFATTLGVADPTANNTITLPNGSGVIVLDTRSVLTAAGSGLSGGGNLSADRSLSLDINGITSKTNVNPDDFLAVYDSTTLTTRKISRNDFLQGVLGALVYRGTWDASTNTPTLTDSTGTNGHTYVVSVAGSQNFGQGPSITFGVGDFVIHNGTEWEKAPSSADVSSVFGRTGAITAQSGDYTGLQITNTPAGTLAATNVQAALNELATEKLGSLNGLTAISQTFANDTNVTITSSGSTHTLGWAGLLAVSRGGTGANTFTPNGVVFGNGTGALQVSAAGTSGQVLLANASGVPTFTSLSGDITISSTGVTTIGANTINLGTDTVGNYIANLGTLTGLTTTGNTGEGSIPTLAVTYGSLANTAVQGNTALTVTAGTNLSGGGTITLGTGGTVTVNTISNPTFATSVTTPSLLSIADLTLDSGSNKIIIGGTDTTLERTGAGSYTVDLKDNAATSLVLSNSSAGGSSVANLNLLDGALQIAGVTVIGSDRSLNITGLTNTGDFTSSGGIVSLNASSNFATNINTGTSTGTITIGGGTAPLVINSTNFDVSSAGALSGITTINTSGLITSVGLTAGTGLVQGTGGLTFTGTISLNVSGGTSATNIGTGTTTGTVTIGGGSAPLVINSTAFDVSSAGALSGITTISLSGAITGATATNTINGLVINSGALSSVASITGSGALTIASGGTGALTFDSASNVLVLAATDTTIQRTAAGTTTIDLVNAGTTTLTITNSNNSNTANLNVEGIYQQNGVSGLTIAACASDQYIGNGVRTSGGILTGGSCRTDSVSLSDVRLKENIVEIGSTLDKVKGLNVYSYDFKCADPAYAELYLSCEKQTGVIAQELEAIFPELVVEGEDGFKRFNFKALNFYNLKAVTELATILSANGDARLNNVSTGGSLRLNSSGALQNITGLNIVSGGANINGNVNVANGLYQINGVDGASASCSNNNLRGTFSGGIATSLSCAGLSDARLKENVVSLDASVLDKIGAINTVNFDFKCNDSQYAELHLDCTRQTGVIAQELAQVFPELVYRGEDGYYRVKYDALNIYTLKAVSELAKKKDTTNDVQTGGVLRLDEQGILKNINGLNMISGGASVVGGIDNNNGGITEAGAISGITGLSAQSITLNASAEGNLLKLIKDGRGVFTVFNNGALELKLDADNAFTVKKADGSDIFNVSSAGGLVSIGSSAPDDAAVLLVLDNIQMEGDPRGVNGAQYYNTTMNRFRCYENSQWQNCLSGSNAEYVLMPQITTWSQPNAEQEFIGMPRTWVELDNVRDFRILIQLNTSGAAAAACRLQYAIDENSAWNDVATTGGNLPINTAGALKSDWMAIAPDAQKEVLIRVMCQGGDYDTSSRTGATPVFNSIRLQVR